MCVRYICFVLFLPLSMQDDVMESDKVIISSPTNLKVNNITETTLILSWNAARSFSGISEYMVIATALKTHADYTLNPINWKFSNTTLHTELLNLHPGTTYNITVQGMYYQIEGTTAFVIAETLIGEPEPGPISPTVIKSLDEKLIIQIPPAVNHNGPVSAYRVVVYDESEQQGFQPEQLKSYKEAQSDGLGYYIAAELQPKDILQEFVVGDGQTYNGFYNAPLVITSSSDIHVSVGVVSSFKGVTRVRYAQSPHTQHGVLILNVSDSEGPSTSLIIGLSSAIAVFGILLILAVLIYMVLRRRLPRRRLADQQELALRGPMIEVENNGYVPEEEEENKEDHYARLKSQVWSIPRNFLNPNLNNIIGYGQFSNVVIGSVKKNTEEIEVAVQVIEDGLNVPTKRLLLHDLDVLIRIRNHSNIQCLIGTCDTPDSLYVVLENYTFTLKDVLLKSRKLDTQRGKFSTLTEPQVLQATIDVAWAMEFINSKKIVHKQLCCRNIRWSEQNVVKLGGIGLTDYRSNKDQIPDYTRWTAHEVFRTQRHTNKSDVWSFGCLLWEACCLGGTPYVSVPTVEVISKVNRGIRPVQGSNMNDDLYQIALNCWQFDPDERPNFSKLARDLEILQSGQNLSFKLYEGFQFEAYTPELEFV